MKKLKVKLSCYFGIFVIIFGDALSTTVKPTNTEQMNNYEKICPKAQIFSNSTFTKACKNLKYVEKKLELNRQTVNTFMCLGVYDTAYKYCNYTSHEHINPFNNVEEFDKELEKFVPDKNVSVETICKNLISFSPSYNVLKEPLQQLAEKLNISSSCSEICFDSLDNQFNKLCSVIAWINGVDKKVSKGTNVLAAETPLNESKTKNKAIQNIDIVNNSASDISQNLDKKSAIQAKLPTSKVDVETQEKVETDDNNNKDTQEPTPTNIITTTDGKVPLNNKEKLEVTNDEKSKNDMIKEVEFDHSKFPKTPDDISQGDNNHLEDNEDHYDQDDVIEPPVDTGNQNLPEIQPRYPSLNNKEDSHFFIYFTVIFVISIAGYIGYHNKQKCMAILVEGRRSKGSRNRRRLSTASYRKLDCTLEEAVTSQCNVNVTHVIY